MATTNFYLDKRHTSADGRHMIIILISSRSTTASISTKIRVSPEQWDKNKIIKHPNASILNANINALKNKIDRKIAVLSLRDDFPTMTATQIKREVEGRNKNTGKPIHNLLSDLFSDYISLGMRSNTRNIYETTLKKLISYKGNGVKIDEVDYEFVVGFDKFLSRTQGINGKAIYLRAFKTICNYARKLKLITDYPFENFSIKHEPTKKKSVVVEKLREFYNYPVKSARIEKFRDIFFLSFYLIGVNSIDLLLARKYALKNGRFEYIRHKTSKKYSIKVEPEAMEIFKKYEGKNYLLDIMDTYKSYRNFQHMSNHLLKEVGPVSWEMVPNEENMFDAPKVVPVVKPLLPTISSNSARHTWATLASELDIPIDVISQALGHSGMNRTTLIYVKFDQKKIDDANRKVIDYFLQKK